MNQYDSTGSPFAITCIFSLFLSTSQKKTRRRSAVPRLTLLSMPSVPLSWITTHHPTPCERRTDRHSPPQTPTHPSPNLGKSTWTGALQATIPAVPPPLQQASPSPTPMESHCCAAKIPVVRVFLTLAGPRQTHGNKCRIDRNRVRSSFLHTCHFQEPSCRLKASVF